MSGKGGQNERYTPSGSSPRKPSAPFLHSRFSHVNLPGFFHREDRVMPSEQDSRTGTPYQDQPPDTRKIISSLKNIKTYNDEQAMLKGSTFSEAQITGFRYRKGAELVSRFCSWVPQELFFQQEILLHHQFYMVVLKFLRLRHVPVKLEPPDARKGLAHVLHDKDWPEI